MMPERLEAFVQRALGRAVALTEAVDAFRTISWIHRSEDGALAFRHEALTLVCAAEHVRTALELRDSLPLAEWQAAAPLADVVCEYAGEMINSVGLFGAIEMLGSDVQFNVRQLVRGVLNIVRGRDAFESVSPEHLDSPTLGKIVRGVVGAVPLARQAVQVLFRSLGDKRAGQVGIPMLWLLARDESQEAADVALQVLGYIGEMERNFCKVLDVIKKDRSSWVDFMLLRDLGIKDAELVDGLCYEILFKRIHAMVPVDRRMKEYVNRTLDAIEREKEHREALMKGQHGQRKRRRS